MVFEFINLRQCYIPTLQKGIDLPCRKINESLLIYNDGHALSIEEAILWYGREAEKAKGQCMNLSSAERA